MQLSYIYMHIYESKYVHTRGRVGKLAHVRAYECPRTGSRHRFERTSPREKCWLLRTCGNLMVSDVNVNVC